MTPATRKVALRAAAKVTLAGALLGCENSPAQNPQPAPPENPRPAPSDTTIATAAAPFAPAVKGKCATAPTPANLQCCVEALRADEEDGGVDAIRRDRGCCKMLFAADPPRYTDVWPCCMAGEAHSEADQRLCSPWGPPVPLRWWTPLDDAGYHTCGINRHRVRTRYAA